MGQSDRRRTHCVVCGGSLDGKRAHALVCGGACRADKSRAERILAGETVDGADSLAALAARRLKRTDARPVASPAASSDIGVAGFPEAR
jgi:hypothetical protein